MQVASSQLGSPPSVLAVENRQLLLLPKGFGGEMEARPEGAQQLLGNVSRCVQGHPVLSGSVGSRLLKQHSDFSSQN